MKEKVQNEVDTEIREMKIKNELLKDVDIGGLTDNIPAAFTKIKSTPSPINIVN